MKSVTFDEAIEVIESLPEKQRESLIEIIKNRLIEERRDRLVQSIKEAREEYARGEIRKGTVSDHKLKGKVSGSWACSAGYDLRIIF